MILQRDLSDFRPAVTREQRQLRRDSRQRRTLLPAGGNLVGSVHDRRVRAARFLRAGSRQQPTAGQRVVLGHRAALDGLGRCRRPACSIWTSRPKLGGKGLATFLLGEAFDRLQNRGIVLVEAQTMQDNAPALAMYEKLGFETVDEGVVFRKGE